MIKPSNKLLEFAKRFSDQKSFADALGVNEATVSRFFRGERGASHVVISAVLKLTSFKFEEAFEVDENELGDKP